MRFTEFYDLFFLFFTSFLSSTLLPGGSEVNLLWLINQNTYPLFLLVLIATVGNTLGGMTNYLIGRFIPTRKTKEKYSQIAINWLKRYGYGLLLFSWLPIIGDPLCLAAGWLRLNQALCLLFIAVGKGMRYVFLVFVASEIL